MNISLTGNTALAAAALALLISTSALHAQPTPPAYKYSTTITVAAPKGSAGELAAKDKTLPVGLRFSPCNATGLDQLAFTLKYDAGKPAVGSVPSSLQNVYLVFHKDGVFFPLVRQPLLGTTGPYFVSRTVTTMDADDTYTAAANNLGGIQTEVVLGGNLTVEELPSGVWNLTAIIANGSAVNFDDPTTWSAWDTTSFILRKPWTTSASTSAACQ